jgi:CRP-like cAMP-binding protein
VIKQGDQGDDFFVVETGNLRVFVVFSGRQEEVEVRTYYKFKKYNRVAAYVVAYVDSHLAISMIHNPFTSTSLKALCIVIM